MKKAFILLLFFGLTIKVLAQEKLLFVEYSENNNAPKRLITNKAILMASNNKTYYLGFKANKIKGSKSSLTENGGIMTESKSINREIFMDLKRHTLNSYVLDVDDFGKEHYFNIGEELPKMKWKLLSETKTINSYKCKKATVYFRGRDYVAWYAPEIPISVGPWKFNGLPGLILEIADTVNEYYWNTIAIKYPYEEAVKLPDPDNKYFKSATIKSFLEYLDKTRKEAEEARHSRMPREWGLKPAVYTYYRVEEELLYEWEANYPKDK